MSTSALNLSFGPLITIVFCLLTNLAEGQKSRKKILERADDLYTAGRYEECIRKLESLHREGRGTSASFHLMALCQKDLKNYDKAVRLFGISIRKNPKDPANYYERGYTYLNMDRYKEAATDFGKYLKIDPKRKASLKNMVVLNYAYCLAETGAWNKAIDYLEQYREKDAMLMHALGYYYAEYMHDNEMAIHWWEETLKVEPGHKMAMENLSIAFYTIEDFNLAFLYVEKLNKTYPDYGRGYYLKALYLEYLEEEGDAVVYYQKARDSGYDWEAEEE